MIQAKLSSYIGISFLVPVAVPVTSSRDTCLNDLRRDDDLEETKNIDEDIEDDEQLIEQNVTETTDEMDTDLVEGTTDDDGNFLP